VVLAVLVLVMTLNLVGSSGRRVTFSVPYGGTNYYAPHSADCPFYSSWTADCYAATREVIVSDMEFMSRQGGGNFQRLWISLDQLFACWDPATGFCGYDRQVLANVADTLRIMAEHGQKADLVLFAQSNRASDVNYFRHEALDGRHGEMRQNYITAARQFVEYIAADATASSAVAVIDIQNEGFFMNREALLQLDTACGESGGCIDRTLTKPFFDEVYATLKEVAPQFLYTVSALKGELLGEDMDYWLSMYTVDVYDVHLYVTDPASKTALFANARNLPKPWFAGEVGTENSDSGQPCYTYDGNDPCTVATVAWWRAHLGPDYGARAVLVEDWGTVFKYSDSGVPALTEAGHALARLS
jgi:hypothetical protein